MTLAIALFPVHFVDDVNYRLFTYSDVLLLVVLELEKQYRACTVILQLLLKSDFFAMITTLETFL